MKNLGFLKALWFDENQEVISSKKFAVKENQSGRRRTGLLSQGLQGMTREPGKTGRQLSEETSGSQQFPVR